MPSPCAIQIDYLKDTEDMISKRGPAHNVSCCTALADKNTRTLYTDATGALSVQSLEGIQYLFVAYDYDTN
jgi:hypothetical protein